MTRLLLKIGLLGGLVMVTLLFPFYTRFPYSHAVSLLINKLTLVKETPSPKIVFVGGSGTYSGLNSQMVHDAMHCPVANVAIYAGHGILPILRLIEPHLNAQDIVVIIPEYGLLHAGLNNTEKTRKWLLAASPLPSLSRYYPLSPTGLKDLLSDLAELATSKLTVLPQSLFAKSSEGYYKWQKVMDQFGDMTDRAQFDKLPPEKLLDRGISYWHKPVETEAIDELNSFAESAARVGAKVFWVFAAFPEQDYEMNREHFDAIYRQLEAELKIPILGTPYDFLYPYQYFQDSVNHLSAEGKTLRTTKVIELLQANLPLRCATTAGEQAPPGRQSSRR